MRSTQGTADIIICSYRSTDVITKVALDEKDGPQVQWSTPGALMHPRCTAASHRCSNVPQVHCCTPGALLHPMCTDAPQVHWCQVHWCAAHYSRHTVMLSEILLQFVASRRREAAEHYRLADQNPHRTNCLSQKYYLGGAGEKRSPTGNTSRLFISCFPWLSAIKWS